MIMSSTGMKGHMHRTVLAAAMCPHLLKPLGGICLYIPQRSSANTLSTEESRHRCTSPAGSQQHIQNDQDMRKAHNRRQFSPRFAPKFSLHQAVY